MERKPEAPNSIIINRETGAAKRLGEKAPVTRHLQKLIDETVSNGYVIIPNAFTDAEVDEANTELRRLASSPEAGPAVSGGRNRFEGLRTNRIYALLNKSRVFDKFALHPDILGLNEHFLDQGFLLNAFHSINIQPGEEPQTIHHDDGFITIPRPHRPFGTAIMVALDSYTKTNGATVVVPKSHTWDSSHVPTPEEAQPVIMEKGSVVYFLGTLWHGGGKNVSEKERRALTVQYCQPWVRPLENQILAVDWEKLNEIPPRLVDMLGYQVGAPFVGYVDGISPRRAVERKMRTKQMVDRYKTKL
ncbi:phytanoyl dioxygenase [Fusarium tjaetaba]|uniref:Phytanoyl dioxygenase n=1 Tax=Fusarium tjaetaba TaxID=1567544 RepID=A0A8H5QR38_9HYPO|nr:phytanoyl dioxygenase [Fusarium tjaetaba]KAF5621340.1 phytanoyl dioxygenase [Fusarium tjaetaba]